MPRCTYGATCVGHRADDLLPFEGVFDGDGEQTVRRACLICLQPQVLAVEVKDTTHGARDDCDGEPAKRQEAGR